MIAASAPRGRGSSRARSARRTDTARHLLGESAGAPLPVARHRQGRHLPRTRSFTLPSLSGRSPWGRSTLARGDGGAESAQRAPGWPRSFAGPGPAVRAPPPRPPAPAPGPAARLHARGLDLGRSLSVPADARELAGGRVKATASAAATSRLRTSASIPRTLLRFWYWPNEDSTVRRIVAEVVSCSTRRAAPPSRSPA